jgi:hypothetical protein
MRAFFLATALAAGAALSGCASVDEAMFGDSTGQSAADQSTTPAPEASTASNDTSGAGAGANAAAPEAQPAAAPPAGEAAAPAPDEEGAAPAEGSGTMAGTLPSTAPPPPPASAAGSAAPPAAVAPGGAMSSVVGVTIAPGADTGTSVNHTIAGIRASLSDIDSRMVAAGQQLASVRSSSGQQLAAYHTTAAQIAAHLQIGTTRANPELVTQWNAAQASLDQLTSNINALNGLAAQFNSQASTARGLLSQIRSTFDVPGAVDEDHRQLTVLEDETNQLIVLLDRLSRDASADLRRETASLNSERGTLAQLQTAIKNGDLYGGGAGRGRAAMAAPESAVATSTGAGGAALVTIRFARSNVKYQKSLYDALTQALQSSPNASFDVVGVSPPRSSAQAVQVAQNSARRHAEEVMHTMTEMGVPAARMNISASTDPAATTSEVRVFLR